MEARDLNPGDIVSFQYIDKKFVYVHKGLGYRMGFNFVGYSLGTDYSTGLEVLLTSPTPESATRNPLAQLLVDGIDRLEWRISRNGEEFFPYKFPTRGIEHLTVYEKRNRILDYSDLRTHSPILVEGKRGTRVGYPLKEGLPLRLSSLSPDFVWFCVGMNIGQKGFFNQGRIKPSENEVYDITETKL